MKTLSSQLKKENNPSTMDMARAAMDRGEFEEARILFARVIERNNNSDEAWVGLAHIHRSRSEKDLSRACLLRGLDENPYNRTAVMKLYDWAHEDGVEINGTFFNKYLDRHPEDKNILKFSRESK